MLLVCEQKFLISSAFRIMIHSNTKAFLKAYTCTIKSFNKTFKAHFLKTLILVSLILFTITVVYNKLDFSHLQDSLVMYYCIAIYIYSVVVCCCHQHYQAHSASIPTMTSVIYNMLYMSIPHLDIWSCHVE